MHRSIRICAFVLAAGLAVSACAAPRTTVKTAAPTPKIIGMPNPASVHCAEQGGSLEIQPAEGGEIGICVFSDGSKCEEWALFRNECKPGQSTSAPQAAPQEMIPNPASAFCEDNNGNLEIVSGPDGEYGICHFPDGSQCEEWAFFRGECKPGQTTAVPTPAPEATPQVSGMPNPASAFCVKQGGKLEFAKDKDGGEYDICVFDDGSRCEEWAYFRGECKPGQTTAVPPAAGQAWMPDPAAANCVKQGGALSIVTASDGGQFGICVFKDGSLCDEWAFFRGECKPGQNLPATKATPQASMANPASVYCIEQGGALAIVKAPDGGEIGLCALTGGKICEEWSFFRKECLP